MSLHILDALLAARLLKRCGVFVLSTLLLGACASASGSEHAGTLKFFNRFCVECHGAKTPKAGVALHELPVAPSSDDELKQWNLILEMLESDAMPPDGKTPPSDDEREAVVRWMKARFREAVAGLEADDSEPVARRLTNFEYQNTLRDLLGFELNLAKYLPEDPAKPYRFNNTAEFLLMGGEQLERYEANAMRAMAAAIVDVKKPEVDKARREWKGEQGQSNELAI